ncbi:MAG: TonB-dependent receptor, partial [Acidobacteriota bacterium]
MRRIRLVFVFLAGAMLPSAAWAQAVVTGVVKDVSGAVLPGVTVEAASPALIEKTRDAVSDGSGQYRIVDLRPGTYSVTFSLPGFNTVKRDGVVLTGSATVVINADLKVGSVEETITVTAATPLVDVQSLSTQRAVTRDLLDAVPTGRTVQNVAQLIPGMSANTTVAGSNLPSSDVGGSGMGGLQMVAIHGGTSNDQRALMDGLPLNTAVGNISGFLVNIGSTQEFSIDTSAVSAEDNSGGVRMNVIPREGGNQFHTTIYGDGTGPALQGTNYTADLAARGFPAPNPEKSMKRSYTFNPAGGVPLVKDKLWLYAAANRTHSQTYTAIYPNANAGNPNGLYVADTTKPQAVFDTLVYGMNGRLTWQINQKNKFAAYYDNQARIICPQATSTVSPEAQSCTNYTNQHFISGTYSAPVTNKLLLQAAVLDRLEGWGRRLSPLTSPGATNVNDSVTGITTGSFGPQEYSEAANRNRNIVGSASFVTGAHAMKAGLQYQWSKAPTYNYVVSPLSLEYTYANGVPTTITEFLDPRYQATMAGDTGAFIQDRWTVKHLTVTGGLRYDRFHSYWDEQTLGPVFLAPTRNISFAAGDGVDWKDITYRFGGAYDLFGNGKTAVKVSINKYLGAQFSSSSFGNALNPASRLGTSTTRSWRDSNSNFVPDCNLQLVTANG